MSWEDLGLDSRIGDGLRFLGLYDPLAIQREAIPKALTMADILCQSLTGSGKTLVYVSVILHKIMQHRTKSVNGVQQTSALVTVPTRELCDQINAVFEELQGCFETANFSITSLSLTEKKLSNSSLVALRSKPDVVISTPALLAQVITSGQLEVRGLQTFVCDEADVIFDLEHADDLFTLLNVIPARVQKLFFSATLGEKIDSIKSTYLRDPIFVQLTDAENRLLSQPVQHLILLPHNSDKFLVTYSLLKLQMLEGFILIFVSTVKTAYKLKIFLLRFGLRSLLYNPELPYATRQLAVERFNLGAEQILIAVDDSNTAQATEKGDVEPKDAGIFRGLDFSRLDVVINFDCPTSRVNYVHRIGRTARGAGGQGHAITYAVSNDKHEEKVISDVMEAQIEEFERPLLGTLDLNLDAIRVFEYRVNDVLQSITSLIIRNYRLAEIKEDIMSVEALREHFEQQSKDVILLRQVPTNALLQRQRRLTMHLRFVPSYLLPGSSPLGAGPITVSPSRGNEHMARLHNLKRRAERAMTKRRRGPSKESKWRKTR
ncbi:ATP-dependent RNA helicase [Giardia muris]|uniref:RNA helicase n=1 Tax=Giardia muris TaxID=5742 RepID=A0A4Z1T1A7_GIAMU|nr:ATP-dependent RNA helicase [Giardia muris]|eukprot:TNJ26319.1 ATP-dependent RNA helicase [Giardia muris]